MIADGEVVGDGSWNLTIYVTDMDIERTMPVKGDMHIGGVMLKLVENLGVMKDWSDHALWWPQRNRWLSRARSTLDQCGVHADAALQFTPMHKALRVQLPDLRYLDCRLDFSVKTFTAVVNLCKMLGIRHPEELSLCKPIEAVHLKANFQEVSKRRSGGPQAPDTNTFVGERGSSDSLERGAPLSCAPATPPPPPRSASATPVANGTLRRYNQPDEFATPPRASSLDALDAVADLSLADSPLDPGAEERHSLVSPKTLIERARMNVGWLNSSLSIMEQGVREWDTLRLRWKFYSFYDLTPRAHDAARLNQLYQQARWQLLNQEIDCTEEEMLVFAALQLQVELQTMTGGGNNSDILDGTLNSTLSSNGAGGAHEDDIDAALSELEAQLEGGPPPSSDITQVPELSDYLRYLKPKRFTLRAYKRIWVVCRDATLRLHRSREAAVAGSAPTALVELRGAEVTPDAHVASCRYAIKLEVPSADGMQEMWLRCETEEQYAQWVAAVRLGSRGRSLADSSFTAEANSVRALLALQRPQPGVATAPALPHHIQAENYIAPRFYKKLKSRLTQRVLENHANVKDLSLLEAKLQFIRAWQSLPDYGQTLFVVRFMGHSKDELIGIAHNRIMRLDSSTGDHLKTWRFSTMKAWNVNWEIKHMMVQFEEGNIIFSCQSADCKVVHEFIGGYIFLSMRSKDANQTLDEELFHKLTGGWS